MSAELPTIVMTSSDRIISRQVAADDATQTSDTWTISSPIPGVRMVGTWQIFKNIWIVLTVAENGHYQIFRSTNRRKYTLVHDHASEIYGVYWVDDGHAIFCAADGWWATTNAGLDWQELPYLCGLMGEPDPDPDEVVPEYDVEVPEYDVEVPEYDTWTEALGQVVASSMAVVQLQANRWALVAYGRDRKIYYAEYPGGDFFEVYDASGLLGKWYPAIAGGPVGTLAGAGDQLLRSDDAGEVWYLVQTVNGIIKSITISNQSDIPTFLIVVEVDGVDTLFWTYDMGDSLQQDRSRVDSIIGVQSVIPTGESENKTTFVLLGKRGADASKSYTVLGG